MKKVILAAIGAALVFGVCVSAQTINVNVSVNGDVCHENAPHMGAYPVWIDDVSVSVEEGTSASEVLSGVLFKNGYTAEGVEDGYITQITKPDGTELCEFSNGKKSGWLYMVNGEAPQVGINNYTVRDNDNILVYFCDDYSEPYAFYEDTAGHWAVDYINAATGRKIVRGYGDGTFKPDQYITKAEFICMMYNMFADDEKTDVDMEDVLKTDWYYYQCAWAMKNEMGNNGRMNPLEYVTWEDVRNVTDMSVEETTPYVTRAQACKILMDLRLH